MGSEQVAQVLRQCGNRVKLVITRGHVDENPSVSAAALASVSRGAFDVSLIKNTQGLGITIAGYVGDKNAEPSGIFVKSITKDSAVDQDGRIHVGDQIVAVDGVDIQGYTNQQAVEVLRHTGQAVHLKLIRRGFRPDEIPPAVAPVVTILPPSAAVLKELDMEGPTETYQGRLRLRVQASVLFQFSHISILLVGTTFFLKNTAYPQFCLFAQTYCSGFISWHHSVKDVC
uniref:PDZ domain-containing protein n=1 Tax=Hippocampus comes TaxID=109280 RepID=A0A3Q2XJE5_HIPCM